MKTQNQRRQRRGKAFTLLELCLGIAILSSVAAFVGTFFVRALDTVRFQNSADLLLNELRSAQAIAIAHQSDLSFAIKQKKRTLQGSIGSKEELKALNPFKNFELQPVDGFAFNNKGRNQIELKVLSTGRFDPPGILRIKQAKKTLWIDLRSPLHLSISKTMPAKTELAMPTHP